MIKNGYLIDYYWYYTLDGNRSTNREFVVQKSARGMNKVKQFQKNNQSRQVLLYRNVFYSRVSATVVLCLLLSFVLQPIERSFAVEPVVNELPQPNNISNLAVDAQLQSAVSNDTETVNKADVSAETVTETASKESVPTNVVDGTQALPEVAPTVVGQTASGGSQNGNATAALITNVDDTQAMMGPAVRAEEASQEIVSPPSHTAATTTIFTDEEIQDLIITSDEIPDVVVEEELATSTENTVAISNVYSDATMQFNKSDCVTVEDGSFYCQVTKQESTEVADGLFAMQDIDGDLEIFVRKAGELTQLTFNKVDDAAPYFDSSSNSIVWHRLIDDRYQIISYALTVKEEIQLTADAVNNMEPSRSGANTVWQRWNNDNWDIVLYDGTETKFITDSGMHDIAPKVKGDLVMWNRLHPDTTQTIELYDITTKEFTTISDTEGGALSNPRMVLVYETEFENGDKITKGYDVETGEITPITSKPAEIPDELPDPDATGETRALLPIKNPTKEDVEFTDNLFPELTSPPTNPPPIIKPGDLVIASSTVIDTVVTQSSTTTKDSNDYTLDLTTPEISPEEVAMTIAVPAYVSATTTNGALLPENKIVISTSPNTASEIVTTETTP